MLLLDEAYGDYKWEVWWDLPWYTMRNIIFAIGAYNYHKEILDEYDKYNKAQEEKEKAKNDEKKEGGEAEQTTFEGGTCIEMATLSNDDDDAYIKFA